MKLMRSALSRDSICFCWRGDTRTSDAVLSICLICSSRSPVSPKLMAMAGLRKTNLWGVSRTYLNLLDLAVSRTNHSTTSTLWSFSSKQLLFGTVTTFLVEAILRWLLFTNSESLMMISHALPEPIVMKPFSATGRSSFSYPFSSIQQSTSSLYSYLLVILVLLERWTRVSASRCGVERVRRVSLGIAWVRFMRILKRLVRLLGTSQQSCAKSRKAALQTSPLRCGSILLRMYSRWVVLRSQWAYVAIEVAKLRMKTSQSSTNCRYPSELISLFQKTSQLSIDSICPLIHCYIILSHDIDHPARMCN